MVRQLHPFRRILLERRRYFMHFTLSTKAFFGFVVKQANSPTTLCFFGLSEFCFSPIYYEMILSSLCGSGWKLFSIFLPFHVSL